jgi:tetratricopeptide (TPR) repeat protein
MATKTQEVTPRGRRWLRPVVLAAIALACAGLSGRAVLRRNAVLSAVPAHPNTSALPPELEAEIVSAEESAHSYVHPVDGLMTLSRLYHANGFYDEALQCYGGLRQLQPGEGRWPHLEASILAQFGRQDEALPREKEAVELAPEYIPARLRLGDEFLNGDQWPDAVRTYTEVLARAPDDPFALLGLAKCAVAVGDWGKAKQKLEQSVKNHPDFIGGLSLLVTVDEHLGEHAAADALKNLIGRREFADLYDPWLDGLMDDCYDPYRISVASAVADAAGRPAAARDLLERAIALSPNTSAFHRQLALLYSREGDFASARQHLERAVAISPSDNDSWLVLSQILNQMGDHEASARALATGLADCPDSYGLHLEHGSQLNAGGHREAAIAEFREAHRLNPAETGPLVQLAGALFAANQEDEALASLREALERQPENPLALATLTFYYINGGNEPAALEWWAHVRRQNRTPPQTVEELKQAFRQKFGRELH